MKKSIVFLSFLNLWSLENGKGAPSFQRTIMGYVQKDWNVVLILPKHNNGQTPELEYDNLKVIYFSTGILEKLTQIRKIGFFMRILYSRYGNYKFYKIGKKFITKNTVIYGYEVEGVYAAKKLSDEFKIPLITRFQGTVLYGYKNTFFNRLKKYPHYEALKTEADITIMTDDGTFGNKVLKDLNNKSKKILFWKNGVDIGNKPVDPTATKTLKQKLMLNGTERILLTVSRLAAWKKVDRAIIAFHEVLKINPSCKLIIIGDGEEKNKLVNLTNELDISNDVIFCGAVEQEKIGIYMAITDVFLSLYDLSNVGNPLLEAMNCGKAIITLNNGNTSEIINNNLNGILLEPNDLNQLPEKILELLKDDALRKELGNNALKMAKTTFWTWDERIEKEVNEVSKLISG